MRATIFVIVMLVLAVGLALPYMFHTNMTSTQLAFCGPCQCYKCKGWFK
jgi:hypothetical protein